MASLTKGSLAPATTGTLVPRKACRRRVLFKVFSKETLPQVGTISFTSSSLANRAIVRQTASSIPGSVEIIKGFLVLIVLHYSE